MAIQWSTPLVAEPRDRRLGLVGFGFDSIRFDPSRTRTRACTHNYPAWSQAALMSASTFGEITCPAYKLGLTRTPGAWRSLSHSKTRDSVGSGHSLWLSQDVPLDSMSSSPFGYTSAHGWPTNGRHSSPISLPRLPTSQRPSVPVPQPQPQHLRRRRCRAVFHRRTGEDGIVEEVKGTWHGQ